MEWCDRSIRHRDSLSYISSPRYRHVLYRKSGWIISDGYHTPYRISRGLDDIWKSSRYTSPSLLWLNMQITRTLISEKWFTLVELIVGMTIFSVGMTAILALLHSTIDTAILSRHEIVTSNLLREQIELIKNTRNTNLRNFIPWDSILLDSATPSILQDGVFIIENDYSTKESFYNPSTGVFEKNPVFMKTLSPSIFSSTMSIGEKFSATRLYYDAQGRLTHLITDKPAKYASFLTITPLSIQTAGGIIAPKKEDKNQWYILRASVITEARGRYIEYDLKTVITDWKK